MFNSDFFHFAFFVVFEPAFLTTSIRKLVLLLFSTSAQIFLKSVLTRLPFDVCSLYLLSSPLELKILYK